MCRQLLEVASLPAAQDHAVSSPGSQLMTAPLMLRHVEPELQQQKLVLRQRRRVGQALPAEVPARGPLLPAARPQLSQLQLLGLPLLAGLVQLRRRGGPWLPERPASPSHAAPSLSS